MPPNMTPPQARRPVTLKRIAEQLGLSVTTVARSLKDGHKISAETVQRVRDTADALGYVRNLDGLRLRTGRSYTIAAHLGRNGEDGDPSSLGLLGGLQRGLVQTDYALRSLPFAQDGRTIAGILSAIRTNRADGFALDRLTEADERVALLTDHDYPFVTLGRPDDGGTHAGLFIDEAAGAEALVAALLAEGRRKVALLDDDPRYLDCASRRKAVTARLADAGLELVEPAPFAALPPARLGAAIVDEVRSGRIDALVCGTDVHLSVALQALEDAGIPRSETGLAVRSATRLPALLPGPLHIAWFAAEHAGLILADLLVRRIEGEPAEDLQRNESPEILTRS